MKKLMSLVFIGCICVFTACNSSSTTEDSVDSAKDVNDSVMDNNNDTSSMSATPVSEDDANWAVEAANGGMTEVEMGKVAQEKATTQRLKDFAAMMVADH